MTEKKKKSRNRKTEKILLAVVLLFSLGLAGFSGFKLISIMNEYKEGDAEYNEIIDNYIKPVDPTPSVTPGGDTPEEPKETIVTIDYDALKTTNKEYIGWIYIPDTNINYPMVIAKDNNKYLKRSFNGRYYIGGTIFMDYRNTGDFTDLHSIIYGHLLKNHTMFYQVSQYRKQDFFKAHPYIYIYLKDKCYKYEVFSFYQTTTSGDVYRFSFDSVADYDKWTASINKQSRFKSGTDLESGQRTITLSTCVDANSNKRWVLNAALVDVSDDMTIVIKNG